MATAEMFRNIFDRIENPEGMSSLQKDEALRRIKRSFHRLLQSYGNYRVVPKLIARGALAHYEKTRKELPNKGCSQENLVDILILALHLCQKLNVVDEPELIKELLTRVESEEGGFDRFFIFLDPLVFPYEIDCVLFPETVDQVERMVPQYLKVLEYFLGQAHNMTTKMKFSELDLTDQNLPLRTYDCDVRFVDSPLPSSRGSTPLLLACHSVNPQAILLLLRYGADPLRPGQANHVIGLQFQHPLYVLLTKLSSSVFWLDQQQHLDVPLREQFLTTYARQVADIHLCLRYFSRSVPQLPIGAAGQSSTGQVNTGKVFYLHPTHQDAVPSTRMREPAELCHLARCSIRKHILLYSRLSQPSSIQTLPIPDLLKKYLDLLID